MRVLLAGGGTGGHIYPSIAIADTIKKHDKYAEIAFIATKRGMERSLVEKAGYTAYHIEMSGLQRRFTLKNIKTAYCYLTAPGKARKLIKSFEPDVVIGTGGYLCWPLLHAAAKLGIPTAVHESNAIPGKAVKMLEGDVDKIFVNFPSTSESLTHREKIVCVGNPLVADHISKTRAEARASLALPDDCRYILLSFGGSLGAQSINDGALDLMKNFSSKHPDVLHIHSTGSSGYEKFMRGFRTAGLDRCKNLMPSEYIYNMPEWEAAADAVICRAGAMTISEMALFGKACVLIPSPYVANNHQVKNAERLAEASAAIVIEEKNLTPENLELSIDEILFGEAGEKLAQNIRAFAQPDAKEMIYREIVKLANRDLLTLIGEEDEL